MRILAISNVFPPGFIGGYELGAFDLVKGLVTRGHDVRVLTSDYFLDDTDEITELSVARNLECVEPSRLPVSGLDVVWRSVVMSDRNIRCIGTELIAFCPDAVVLFNAIGLGLIGILRFCLANGMRPVVYLMDNQFHQLAWIPAQIEPFALLGGKAFLDDVTFAVMSSNLQQEVEGRLGRPFKNAKLIPGWAGALPLTRHSGPPAAPGAVRRFVFTSRIAQHKGIDVLLDAASRLLEARCDAFSIDIFGAGETAWLLQMVTARGLTDHVQYKGLIPKAEMTARLAEYEVLLFPTWAREPFGFVVAEAAAAGCIPVMTAGIGASEWFFDGIDSIKIHRDPNFLAASMLQLMMMPASDLANMRKAAQQTAQRFLRFDTALTKLEALLIQSAGHSSPISAARVRGAESALALINDMWMPRHHE